MSPLSDPQHTLFFVVYSDYSLHTKNLTHYHFSTPCHQVYIELEHPIHYHHLSIICHPQQTSIRLLSCIQFVYQTNLQYNYTKILLQISIFFYSKTPEAAVHVLNDCPKKTIL